LSLAPGRGIYRAIGGAMRFGIGRAGILKYEMEGCFRFIRSGRRIGLLRVIMIERRWILWSLDD
jgi:hypothetical protein